MKTYKDILEKQIKELEKRIAENSWEKEELKKHLKALKLQETDIPIGNQQLLNEG